MPIAYYGSQISPHLVDTPEGFLICKDVPIARTGPQDYLARELMLDGDPERLVTVQRHPEDVFEEATLASFEGKPICDGHPPENVSPENYAAYTKGHVQNVRRDGDYIVADLYINDANLANEVRNNVKREVSCGYLCNYVPDGAGYKQSRIRGNHVAVVPKGRAGAAVAIKDAAPEAEKGRKTIMSYWKTFLAAFAGAAKDAEPEELDKMVETTAAALDAEPAERAPDAEPAKEEPAAEPAKDEETIEAPKGDDIGSKLDRILEMLEAKARGGRGEHPLHDETDLDEMIEKLSGKGEGESALTIPVENDCMTGPAKDAAVELLRKVRPAVAAIEDKQTRAKVTDALLSAIKGKDVMQDIAKAALDSARANAEQTKKTSYEKICADSSAAYAERNPHTKKEG
jgi:hypothetical protein